jgi:crossover junction endodeoxyribonuclease RuvC
VRPVVGIDPSLTSTGIAIAIDGKVETGRVRSKGSKADGWEDRVGRIITLAQQITDQVPANSLVIIEAPSYGSVSTSAHDRAGLWWLIFTKLYLEGCDILPVTPAQRMTYAVGKGGGAGTDKDNILAAAIKRYPEIDITGNDVADAVILAAIGARLDGHPLEDTMPAANLRALAKLTIEGSQP